MIKIFSLVGKKVQQMAEATMTVFCFASLSVILLRCTHDIRIQYVYIYSCEYVCNHLKITVLFALHVSNAVL